MALMNFLSSVTILMAKVAYHFDKLEYIGILVILGYRVTWLVSVIAFVALAMVRTWHGV